MPRSASQARTSGSVPRPVSRTRADQVATPSPVPATSRSSMAVRISAQLRVVIPP
jgi:hypothetical protein